MKQGRFLIIELLLFLFAATIIGRLFYWQVLKHESFEVVAKEQTEDTVFIGAERGKIYASDGSLLVSNQNAYLVYVILPELKKTKPNDQSFDDFIESIADRITPILLEESIATKEKLSTTDKDLLREQIGNKLMKQLRTEGLVWVPLAKKVSENTKNKIADLAIKGVGFEDDTKRFYSEGNLGASLLGFVAKDSAGNDKGYFGLEGFYDDKLKGRSGRLIQEVDAMGRPILIGSSKGLGAFDGDNLETTIDRTVQYVVEKHLIDGVKRFGAKAGAAIVLDAKTSAVLAVASTPAFNPLDPAASSPDTYKNLAISEVYEPGSTFKPITFATALDSGKIDANTICPCTGPIKIDKYEIQTVDNKYYPNSTIAQILQHSDNIGAAFASQKIGKDLFLKYIKDFGFGSQLGIDLQGEEAGILKERQNWSDVDLVTGAFGQGLSVTALQMVNAIAAIANDGALMKPYVVKKIIGEKQEIDFGPKKTRQVVKESSANLMKSLLSAAVEGGEAKKIIPKGYRVAGKTGTAQVPIAGKYSTKTVASFVGFGPLEDPKYAMIVVLFEPSASIFAADTAEPLFFQIAKELYPYWGIAVTTP